jgi:hypothetical protein
MRIVVPASSSHLRDFIMPEAIYDELSTILKSSGPEAAFERLASQLREEGRYHELFDARLMQSRWRLDLPVIQTTSLDELPEPARTKLEDAYLDACREVGRLLLDQGRVREAWMYLRPVGDKQVVTETLEKIEPRDENVEELIEVALHQAVCPRLGFQLVLKNYGTCNAITMFDSHMHERPKAERQEVAALLIGHLHEELKDNLVAEITRQEGTPPREPSIEALVADRDWLFADGSYHIDTSHLSATVRFARVVEDPQVLKLAVDLTEYGRRLDAQYQYAGDEPFANAYAEQGLFFRAQLGQRVEEALALFGGKARELEQEEQGTAPAEVYVALLARLGRQREAIDALNELIPTGTRLTGFAPSMGELASASGEFQRMASVCRDRGDLLGFAAGLFSGAKKT